jgi:hypothetical protein
MSRADLLFLLDRGPRYASLLGLLGLIGIAGIANPELYRFSTLSFLSYVSFFRFFRGFFDPSYRPTIASTPFLVLAIVVGAVSLWLSSLSPMFGFAGFAGCCGLYDPPEPQLATDMRKNERARVGTVVGLGGRYSEPGQHD